MKAKLNWKEIGRFVSVLVQLFTVVTNVFKKAKVGPEIVEWLVGSGKDTLVGKLEELAAEFAKANPPEASKPVEASALRAEIDTDFNPGLPFDGAKVEVHVKGGKVVIEKKDGELWIDGKKVVLHRVARQMNGNWLNGHELREELSGKLVLNACILDFLLEHTDFIPEAWKKEEAGSTIYIFFWGTIYRSADGSFYVRYLCWGDGVWRRHCSWLGVGWGGGAPAALLAG